MVLVFDMTVSCAYQGTILRTPKRTRRPSLIETRTAQVSDDNVADSEGRGEPGIDSSLKEKKKLQRGCTSECYRCVRVEFGKGGAKERLALGTTTHRL